MGVLLRGIVRRFTPRVFNRLCSSLARPAAAAGDGSQASQGAALVVTDADKKDRIIVSGYDAWWRVWQQQRTTFPALGVQDIIGSQGTVVLDANIGAVFARLELGKRATSPDRQVFLGMLQQLVAHNRLSAPPKLVHRYAVAVNRTFKTCIPEAPLGDEERMKLGQLAQEMMQWIVEGEFDLPRDASKSVDFLVALLQCGFLYRSTILLTNNKDYYFLLKAAKQLQDTMHASYPEYAATIDLATIRIVFVQEQLKLNVYQVVRV